VVAVVAAQSGAVLAFQPHCNWVGQRPQATAQASCRASRTPLDLNMGLRDNMKKAVGTVAAGISFALAPSAARAMDSGVITQPRLVLPSQEAFMQRPEVLMSEPDPIHIRVVKSPIFQGSVGIVAAGAAGAAIYQQVQKKQTESMRSMLSSTAGVDLDASILDEARVNRPGAKKFEYSGGGPQFGQYRPPPEKLMKDVKDKYKFRTYGEKAQMDDEAMSKLDSVFGTSPSETSPSDGPKVEVVGADAGPKTAEQKALEKELDGASMDEMLARAMADPTAMDPAMLAAALPQLQQQLSEVLKEGISPEEIADVRKSFTDMGIDVNELFKALDEMEAAGMDSTLGKDGKEFFKTLRQILVAK